MTTFEPSNSRNAFLRTTDIFPPDPQELLIHLTHSYTETAQAVNVREIAQYEEVELITGQTYFTPNDNEKKRYVFRKVFEIGVINPGATSTFAHGITGVTRYVHIYGTCNTNTPDSRPIPHASVTANANIEVIIGAANITINNGAASPTINDGLLTLEYLKQ